MLTASNLWSHHLNKAQSTTTWMGGWEERNRLRDYRRAFPASPGTGTHRFHPHFISHNESNGPAQLRGAQNCAFLGPREGRKSKIVMPIVKSSTATLGNLLSPSEPSFLIQRRVMNVSISLGCYEGCHVGHALHWAWNTLAVLYHDLLKAHRTLFPPENN